MLVPVGLGAVLVHAGAVPLPGRVEIRDLDGAAQVAGALGVAAGAVPVVGPERRLVKFGVVGFDRNGLPEPVHLPAAVGAAEDHEIAADQSEQVTEQRRRQPLGRRVAAVTLAVMTGRGSGPAAAPGAGPGAAASPALLPSTVTTRIPVPFGEPGGMTILGSTAWISDWSASRIAGFDLAAGRVSKTLQVGGQRDEPVSMTSGAGSLWVLGFAGPLLRIDPASGVITKRFPVRGLGAAVAYGDGFLWMITDDPAAGGGQEYLYKIDPSRDVIVKAAPIPGAGPACAAFPGPRGIWIACAGVDRITLINPGSLKPVQRLPVRSGGYTPQIVPGQTAVWVLTPSGLARADPATARITAIIHVGYASSAMSAPALNLDSPRRLWITGPLLIVVLPGTLTASAV